MKMKILAVMVCTLAIASDVMAKEALKVRFGPLYEKFGRDSETKIEIVSGPVDVEMRNGSVPGKRWMATSGKYRFKLTIQESTGVKLCQLIELLQKLPGPYMKACQAVSDDGEDGIAIYADLGGSRGHGGKGYINLAPHADALVVAHEAGHTLEQVARESDPGVLDKWEEAIKADKISVSDYGDEVRHEDLGEFAQAYAVCLHAGPEYLATLKKLSPARFALWEKILSTCVSANEVEPAVPIEARPFPLNRVRLLDSPFKKAMEINRAYLLKLDPDRMLWPFHERAGLPTTGERYGGWEQKDCVGQTSGHYLSACSLMYASTGDEELKRRVNYMVSELAKVQEKHGDGYAGAMRTEVWDKTFSGDIEVHQWGLGGGYVPWYVLHKTYAGLIDAYVHVGNKQALEIARRFVDWAKKGTDNLDDEQFRNMLRCECGGMNESLANLYALTGNKDCLTLARRFEHKVIVDPLAEKRDELEGKHVNTQIPKIIGAARLYELAGQERDATISRFFWDRVVNTRSFAPGGVDLRERFCVPGTEAAHLAWNSCESCCVYNMLKLTRHLFGWQPDAKYMDYYERGLYNHILGSQDPDSGGFTYFYSLRPGHFKVYSSPFDSMWCCVGTGIENHSKYADTIYFHNKHTLWVNLFIPSELDWKEKNVNIRQETMFPEEDTTTIAVLAPQPQEFTVKVRVPYWATQEPIVTINGEKQAVEVDPQSYLTLSRTWKGGDKIQVKLPMGLHLYHARDDRTLAVVMYGPLVLAGELGREGMPDDDCCAGNTSHAGNMAPPVPALVVDSEDLPTWIKRVEGERLKFRTSGVGKPKDVSLIPLANLHHQRYTVYWKTMSTDQWNSRPRVSVKPAAVSKDKLSAGVAYRYYEGSWDLLPEFEKLNPINEGVADNFDLSMRKKNDNFGLVFSGYLKVVEAADYCFATKSDDGSRLRISGEEIVDHDGTHPMDAKVGLSVSLESGFYPIKLDYFEKIYHEGLEVYWYSSLGGGWQRIPKDALFHQGDPIALRGPAVTP